MPKKDSKNKGDWIWKYTKSVLTLEWFYKFKTVLSSVQLLSRVQLFAIPWISTAGLPVHHQLPEFTQTHVHWVSDAIQSPHPLSSLSPPELNLSQHQGLFKWVSSLHQVAKLLEYQLQHLALLSLFKVDYCFMYLHFLELCRVLQRNFL